MIPDNCSELLRTAPTLGHRVGTMALLAHPLPGSGRLAPHLTEDLYLQFGDFTNAFSVAFDVDLQRHHYHCKGQKGIISYSRCPRLGVTIAWFAPLCDRAVLQDVLDDFLITVKSDRLVWWKASEEVATLLAERGYLLTPYGLENDVAINELTLGGTRLRGLRRQVEAARGSGIVVERVEPTAGGPVWDELRQVSDRWLATRPQPLEVRRVTRRTPHRVERHCTKVVARTSRGATLGWAAFDHLHSQGSLIGCGLNAVRYDPSTASGVAALLACDGAAIVHAGADHPSLDGRFRLALGESPLPSEDELGRLDVEIPSALRTGRALQTLFNVLRERGRRIYGVRGLSDWKRKWRADQSVTYCAVRSELPLREVLAFGSAMLLP